MVGRMYRAAQLTCGGVVLLLAACGGGGGGGGSSGPDLSTAPGLSLSPTSVGFSAVHNGVVPPAQSIQITLTRSDVFFIVVSYLATPTPPTWLTPTPSLTGSVSNWTLTGGPITTALAPGTYTTMVRIAIQGAGHNVLAYRDVPVSYTVTSAPATASPTALNFSSVVGGAAPAAQPVALMGDVGAWTASPSQTWIGVAPSSGSGAGNVSASVDVAGLDPNTYNGTITFTTAGGTAVVNVTLTVAAPAIQPSLDSLTFSGINGAPLPPQSLNIGLNNGAALNWTATSADSWLVLSPTSGTAADPLTVSVNPANGTLASGAHSSTITLQGSFGGSQLSKTVNVSLTLIKATLTASPASITLGGSNGRDFSGVPLQLSVNTGVNSFAWSSSTLESFIQPSPTAGNVSATPATVTLTPDPTGLLGGTHTGSVGFSTQINGDTVLANVPVTFNQESHKLLVDGNGVGFASMPTVSSLARTLKVRDNLGLATNWSAGSDRTWLSVTASGTADSDLTLTANPIGLTPDTVNLATVTITSSDASVENTEKIRVGFWVGSADPTPTSISVTSANIAADPIRPYAYAAVGGDILVYNIYTGALVTTITGVSSGTVGYMTISHDGSTLYAVDATNSKIVPVNLDTSVVGTAFPFSSFSPLNVIDYTRTNGVELVISGSGGQIFNAATGTLFSPTFGGNVVVAASRGGSRFCTVNVVSSPYSISCPTLDFTSLNSGQLLLGNTFEVSGVGSFGRDAALRADGTILYVASGGVSEISAYLTSGSNPAYVGAGNSPAPTGLHPNNVEISADGRILASAPNPVFDPADVWIFAADGTPLTTLKVAAGGSDQLFDRQLRISGDGLRLITITGNPFVNPNTNVKLNFTTVP